MQSYILTYSGNFSHPFPFGLVLFFSHLVFGPLFITWSSFRIWFCSLLFLLHSPLCHAHSPLLHFGFAVIFLYQPSFSSWFCSLLSQPQSSVSITSCITTDIQSSLLLSWQPLGSFNRPGFPLGDQTNLISPFLSVDFHRSQVKCSFCLPDTGPSGQPTGVTLRYVTLRYVTIP